MHAVYFLAEWLKPFNAVCTREKKFRLSDGSPSDTTLMRGWKSKGVK